MQNQHKYQFSRKDCKICPLKSKCTPGKYDKRVYRHTQQDVIDWADECFSRGRRKQLMGRRRSLVEGSFADAANNHSYKHSRWRSLERMTIQNLRKLIASSSRAGHKSAATMNVYLRNLMFIRVLQHLYAKIAVEKRFRTQKMNLIGLDINQTMILF